MDRDRVLPSLATDPVPVEPRVFQHGGHEGVDCPGPLGSGLPGMAVQPGRAECLGPGVVLVIG
jgi:hypothetical protein